jgi:hypothetical protein
MIEAVAVAEQVVGRVIFEIMIRGISNRRIAFEKSMRQTNYVYHLIV